LIDAESLNYQSARQELVPNRPSGNAILLGRKADIEDYLFRHSDGGFDADFLNIRGTMANGRGGVGGWTWTRNKRFINDAIEGGREIRIVTDPYTPLYWEGNVFQRELRFLRARGYTFERTGDYWIARWHLL
jgi:hypothetical protein